MISTNEIKMHPFNFGGRGEPDQLSGVAAQSADGSIQIGIWESGPGVLELYFPWTETILVLEGRAHLKNLSTQETIELQPGMMLLFEAGSHWRWQIPWKLKKIFTLVDAIPSEADRANTSS